jgi:hypothetical protein
MAIFNISAAGKTIVTVGSFYQRQDGEVILATGWDYSSHSLN